MGKSPTPTRLLDIAYEQASTAVQVPIVADTEVVERVKVACNSKNGAGVRLLLATLLAKVHLPEIDIRKPYTEIGGADTYSGRTYDEQYVTAFIHKHQLPCNPTTAFLTPAFRTKNLVLTPDLHLGGRPAALYCAVLQLLTDVQQGRVRAEDLLAETVRQLLLRRNAGQQRIETHLSALRALDAAIPLSCEGIVALIDQHLKFKQWNTRGVSRLPVLIVAAAYNAASQQLGERVLPLMAHNAADEQTGSLGDVEVTLPDDDSIVTCYEMKTRRITRDDIDRALPKIHQLEYRIDNYIFITTDDIDPIVQEYARGLYEQTGGTEFVILDCIGFIRHFLHLFHRLRVQSLNVYQELLLAEPESAVSQTLKETFLVMRYAAESGASDSE